MKNREMIATINGLYRLREREYERDRDEKVFKGRILFAISRNLRTLEKEYSENYTKDLQELRDKYYTKKETDVTVPADLKAGTEEHTEKRQIEVLKPDCEQEAFDKELNDLLDMDVSIPISKISADELENVYDYRDTDVLDFMVE